MFMLLLLVDWIHFILVIKRNKQLVQSTNFILGIFDRNEFDITKVIGKNEINF